MKISPAVLKIYEDYFKSFEKKRRIIKSAPISKSGQLWVIGDIVTAEEKNKGRKGDNSNSNATVTKTISRINELLQSHVKVIELHICSYGGEVDAGLAIYEYLRKTNLPIITFAYGNVCSMAADLFEIGTIRKMTASSTLLVHHTQGGADGTPEKIIRIGGNLKYQDVLLYTLTSMRSGILLKKLYRETYPLKYYPPEEAIKLNLADEII